MEKHSVELFFFTEDDNDKDFFDREQAMRRDSYNYFVVVVLLLYFCLTANQITCDRSCDQMDNLIGFLSKQFLVRFLHFVFYFVAFHFV